jgi:hypothetical protein
LLPEVRGIADARPHYPANRAPLAPSPLVKLPIGSIEPRGWLRLQLVAERDGMIGRLAEISPWLNFEKSAWGNTNGAGNFGWEELPYWLKGYGDLGYVLRDEKIIASARKWIESAMASQRADGWFGPRELLASLKGKPDLWPNMVMLNILQSCHEYSGDLQRHRVQRPAGRGAAQAGFLGGHSRMEAGMTAHVIAVFCRG